MSFKFTPGCCCSECIPCSKVAEEYMISSPFFPNVEDADVYIKSMEGKECQYGIAVYYLVGKSLNGSEVIGKRTPHYWQYPENAEEFESFVRRDWDWTYFLKGKTGVITEDEKDYVFTLTSNYTGSIYIERFRAKARMYNLTESDLIGVMWRRCEWPAYTYLIYDAGGIRVADTSPPEVESCSPVSERCYITQIEARWTQVDSSGRAYARTRTFYFDADGKSETTDRTPAELIQEFFDGTYSTAGSQDAYGHKIIRLQWSGVFDVVDKFVAPIDLSQIHIYKEIYFNESIRREGAEIDPETVQGNLVFESPWICEFLFYESGYYSRFYFPIDENAENATLKVKWSNVYSIVDVDDVDGMSAEQMSDPASAAAIYAIRRANLYKNHAWGWNYEYAVSFFKRKLYV